MAQVQEQVNEIVQKLELLHRQVQTNSAEHQAMHSIVTAHDEKLTSLHGRLTSAESIIAAGVPTSGIGGDNRQRRLDRLSEGKESISRYDGQSKGQGFREWAFDVRDLLEQYDSRLSTAMDQVESSITPIGDHDLANMNVHEVEDKAMRRVLARYCGGLAKTFVRSRAEVGGLELWRQMSQYFDPMTDARAMADGGLLTQPPVAKDWEALGRQITAWEAQCRQYESRTDRSQHLPETFKMQAIWTMVPEKDKNLLFAVRRQCTTVVQLKKHLLEMVQERSSGHAPMLIGNVEGNQEHADGEEKELVDPETGEMTLYKFEAVSGRWSRSGVRGRKQPGAAPPGRKKDTKDMECYRCGKKGHIKPDCKSTVHKDGRRLDGTAPGKVPAKNVEEEQPDDSELDKMLGGIELCALEPLDPLQDGGDAWHKYLEEQRLWGLGASRQQQNQTNQLQQNKQQQQSQNEQSRENLQNQNQQLDQQQLPYRAQALDSSIRCKDCMRAGVHDTLTVRSWSWSSIPSMPRSTTPFSEAGNSENEAAVEENNNLEMPSFPWPARTISRKSGGIPVPPVVGQLAKNLSGAFTVETTGFRNEETVSSEDLDKSECEMTGQGNATSGMTEAVPGEKMSMQEKLIKVRERLERGIQELEEQAIPLCALKAHKPWPPPNAVKYELTVDSGAGKSVAPRSMIGEYRVAPSAGSIAGQKFVGPGGEIYHNEGKASLNMLNEKGQSCVAEFQVTSGIKKPLAAVSDSCDKGNIVIFDAEDPCMLRRDSPEGQAIRRIMTDASNKMKMYKKNGVYVTPVWVVPANEAGFTRPGK